MLRNALFAVAAAVVVVLIAILSVTLFFVVIGVMVVLVIVRVIGEYTFLRGKDGASRTAGANPFTQRPRPGSNKVIDGEYEAHWADEPADTSTTPKDGDRHG